MTTAVGYYGQCLTEDDLGTLGTRIGGRNEGDVHELPDYPSLVYKRYHVLRPRGVATSASLEVAEHLASAGNNSLLARATWPVNPVVEGADLRGVVLARIPDDYFYFHRGKSRLCEWQLACDPEGLGIYGLEPLSARDRLGLTHALVQVFAAIEGCGLTVADVSGSNGAWCPRDPTRVIIIDIDSAHTGMAPDTAADNWGDPYVAEGMVGQATMRYRVALLVGRILSGHWGFPHGPTLEELAAGTDGDIAATLTQLLGPQEGRPALAELATALEKALNRPAVSPEKLTADNPQPRSAHGIRRRAAAIAAVMVLIAFVGDRSDWFAGHSQGSSTTASERAPSSETAAPGEKQGVRLQVAATRARVRAGPGPRFRSLRVLTRSARLVSTGHRKRSVGGDLWIGVKKGKVEGWVKRSVVRVVRE